MMSAEIIIRQGYMMLNELILILTQFAGGPGDPANNVVRFLLAAFFWATLYIVSFWLWQATKDRRHLYFSIAAAIGVSRELFMFVAEYGSFRGYISFPAIFRYYPPLEHSVAILAIIMMGYSFLRFYFSYEKFSRYFLIYSSLLTILTYIIIAPLWITFLKASGNGALDGDSFIGAQFHDFWGDLAFRLLGALVSLIVLGAFLYSKNRQIRFPFLAFFAFFCFFVDDALQAVNDLCNDRFAPLFAPIRHFLHIAGIMQLVGGYWWEVTWRFKNREKFLNTLLDAIPDHISYKNTEGVFLGCNRNFADTFIGSPKDRIIGRTEKDFVREQALEDLSQKIALEAIATDSSRTYEVPYTLTNGKHALLETIQTPFHDDDGRVAGLIGVSRDITERKLAEEALRTSEERYRAVFSLASEGILLFTTDGKLIEANESFARMHGYSSKELRGIQLKDLDTPETFRLAPERMRRILNGETLTFDVEHYHKDGHVFPLEVSSSLISPGGESQIQSFHRDTTERKRTEAEKEKLQIQFQQAQKMEAVGRLAGGVAHDFNNLLTVITGYSELLLQKIGKESPMHGEVEQIKQAGERAASLTRQLLVFSRKQIIEPKVLDLNSLTTDLGKMLVRLIGENIDLKIVRGKGLGLVKVDPGQFEQVLINLVVNARDAMPDGGTLRIETANVELDEEYCARRPYEIHPGRYVRLVVSDTGHGMTEETRKKIFEPFFTTKAKEKGTGLGLSMIYGAVKQADGSIEVHSKVGIGTTFEIYLPRVEGEAVQPVKGDRPADLPVGTETVLVVEDEANVRAMCSQILLDLGYKVVQARNSTEAIALAQGYGDRIDLLLTDVVMPGLNGAELATQLVVRHPKMKVLFTSGYTDDVISRHGVLADGVSFIGKPYTPLALAGKVREVLDKA
jgi:two-component system cell cycle sensor histidine kinase/response regulator CckA